MIEILHDICSHLVREIIFSAFERCIESWGSAALLEGAESAV